jgi:hypothetical protein
MKQMGVKKHDNQVRYNTPIKFKSTQATTHAPKSIPNKSSKKPKPHASQAMFLITGYFISREAVPDAICAITHAIAAL